MDTLSTLDVLVRLASGAGCGALIGIERQWRARMAGLRTNALVAAGANARTPGRSSRSEWPY